MSTKFKRFESIIGPVFLFQDWWYTFENGPRNNAYLDGGVFVHDLFVHLCVMFCLLCLFFFFS